MLRDFLGRGERSAAIAYYRQRTGGTIGDGSTAIYAIEQAIKPQRTAYIGMVVASMFIGLYLSLTMLLRYHLLIAGAVGVLVAAYLWIWCRLMLMSPTEPIRET
jgi:hypothetical protein